MGFAREQRISIGGKAFTEYMQDYQSDKLTAEFPMYDANVVRAFAASIALQDPSDDIEAEQQLIEAFLLKK